MGVSDTRRSEQKTDEHKAHKHASGTPHGRAVPGTNGQNGRSTVQFQLHACPGSDLHSSQGQVPFVPRRSLDCPEHPSGPGCPCSYLAVAQGHAIRKSWHCVLDFHTARCPAPRSMQHQSIVDTRAHTHTPRAPLKETVREAKPNTRPGQ